MDLVNLSLSNSLLISIIGFATVFLVLIVLMFIISAISKFASEKQKASAPAPVAQPVQENKEVYTGVKLIDVTDKDAAVIMAIVANKLDKPLDNLRFISIREVK